MPLRLYSDECVDQRIVTGLRRRSVDVVTAGDQGLLGSPDERHLARATELGRVILTGDFDFLRLTHAPSAPFPGVIFLLPATAVGDAVRAVALLATVLEPAEMANWVEWVP